MLNYSLLLGGFDGLHTGHGTLLRVANDLGAPVAITSITGLKGDLFLEKERELIFARAGISKVLCFAFSEKLKDTPPEEFLNALFAQMHIGAIICGEDFRFGKDRAGTPALLKRLAPCPVHVLPLFCKDGQKVSVSALKEHLKNGRMDMANELFLHPFFCLGEVKHGRKVGRQYGFPTLNVAYSSEKFSIKEGVYGGYVKTPKGDYPAIINYGARPTFQLEEKIVEAYLDGFSGDLYGAQVEIYPTDFYRPIQKFESPSALKLQLEQDKKRLENQLQRGKTT